MVKVNMAPVPIVVPVRIMLCGDVFAKAGKALSQLPCDLRARRLCARATDRRLCVRWMPKRGEARSRAFKTRNTIWHAHSAKADATSTAANSMCDLSATTEPSCLETTTAKVAAATEASSAAMPSRPCYGTGSNGCNADYQSNYLLYFHALKFDLVLIASDCASA